jgi:hypothetical protein
MLLRKMMREDAKNPALRLQRRGRRFEPVTAHNAKEQVNTHKRSLQPASLIARQALALRIARHGDDPLGAQLLRGGHTHETDGSVANDSDRYAPSAAPLRVDSRQARGDQRRSYGGAAWRALVGVHQAGGGGAVVRCAVSATSFRARFRSSTTTVRRKS